LSTGRVKRWSSRVESGVEVMTFWRIGPDVISNRRTAYVGLYGILTFYSPQIISIRFESIRPIRFAYTHGRNPGGGRERGRVRRAPSQNMCVPLPSARTPLDVKRCQNVTVSSHRDWRHWWVMRARVSWS